MALAVRRANVDYRARLALVAEDEHAGRLLLRAIARYEPETAEARGVRSFTAHVLTDNRRMLHVLRRVGEIERSSVEDGVVTVEFGRRHSAGRAVFA